MPVHVQAGRVAARTWLGRVYTRFATAFVAGTSPPASVIVVPVVGGSAQDEVVLLGVAAVVVTTVLLSAEVGATSLLVIAQLTVAPSSRVTVLPVGRNRGGRSHLQALAV